MRNSVFTRKFHQEIKAGMERKRNDGMRQSIINWKIPSLRRSTGSIPAFIAAITV